jgi:LuxR family maltose regulon positive regulatory protein
VAGAEDLLGPHGAAATPPPARPGHVRRDRLLRLLPPAAEPAVVLLVAPAGYGKTTLLGQWARGDGRAFAWVGVEDADDDPARLLRHVSRVLHRITPLDDELRQTLQARDADSRTVVVPRLIDWLTRQDGRGVLVLDDLHRLSDHPSLAVVTALAGGLPDGWSLAVASRRRPPANLVPTGGQRQYVELGRDELALDAQEAAAVLERTGTAVPDDAVATIVRRVEGWPAAVYLSALSIRASAGPAPLAPVVEGVGHLSAYVETAVLDHLPAGTVRLLLRTSVLDRLSGPLCDAVAETTGAGAVLAELARDNLFVLPQDRRGEWYRYHRLFADVLRAELRRREPGTEARLHRLAAAWFDGNGRPEDAVEHALAGGDVTAAARLVTSCGQALADTGRIRTLRRWVEEIGDEGVAGYPPYAVIAGWVWALEADGRRARHFLAAAESAEFAGRPADGSASLESAVVLLRGTMAPLGVERMMADARRALELEPPGSSWYPLACMLLGTAHVLHGSGEAAVRALERAAYFGHDRQSSAVVTAHAQLSLLAADRGEWPAAAAAADDAVGTMRRFRLHEYPHCALAHAAAARVAAHQGDRPTAEHHAGSATGLAGEGSAVAFPWLSVQVAVTLGRTRLSLDDLPAAQRMARDARRHMAGIRGAHILAEDVDRLEDALARRRGLAGPRQLTEAELRVLDLLPTHLTLTQIARELGVSRNTVKTHVAAIYRKVGAPSRARAVSRSRELGLLGPAGHATGPD